MKNTSILLVGSLFLVQVASAATFTITCGKSAYDALESNELDQAEFYTVIKTKGTTEKPVIQELVDEMTDLTSMIKRSDVQADAADLSAEITVKGGLYSITVSNCGDIDSAKGTVTFKKATPRGMSGYGLPTTAKCTCLKK